MEVQGGLQVGRNVAPGQRMQVQRSRVGQMLSNLTTSRVIVGAQRSGTVQGLLPAELLSAPASVRLWMMAALLEGMSVRLHPVAAQAEADWCLPVRLGCRWSPFC